MVLVVVHGVRLGSECMEPLFILLSSQPLPRVTGQTYCPAEDTLTRPSMFECIGLSHMLSSWRLS